MITAMFSRSRFARAGSFAAGFRLAVCALVLLLLSGLGSASCASAPADLLGWGPVSAGSVTHGHVFLYSSQGPMDVTALLRMVDGQIYVFCTSGPVPIVISYDSGVVYDSCGDVIGFVDLSSLQAPSTSDPT